MKVIFVHLDLGIGGAEMLVVNAAVAAKKAGHDVVIYTSHHDPKRCFQDTTGRGMLADAVRVRGDWLPRHLAFGRFTALCAVGRMLWLALCILLSQRRQKKNERVVIFCDGVSAPVPLLRLAGPVLFYCHFPDKLLCVGRGSLLKRLYRWPLDRLEEITTGCASSVAVNSKFTASVFREAFPRLGRRFLATGVPEGSASPGGEDRGCRGSKKRLRVLYPPTNVSAYDERGYDDLPPAGQIGPMVSLNRFERKKNLPLAVEAFGWALQKMGKEEAKSRGLHLVVAGGYDERVAENVEHLEELKTCARAEGLEDLVEFRTNIADEERSSLLRRASCVLYTPSNEHFGIVPVEATCSGAPVVAVNSGGPLETVVDGSTGFLCPPTKEAFGAAIVRLAENPSLGESMGKAGRNRVKDRFSMESFAGAFETSLRELESDESSVIARWLLAGVVLLAAYFVGLAGSNFGKDAQR